MANQQLLNYIKESLQKGIDKESIQNTLLRVGWQKTDIDEGFIALQGADANRSAQEQAPASPATFAGPFVLLASAWALYRKRFIVFWGILLIPSLVATVLVGVAIFGSVFLILFFLQYFTSGIVSLVLFGTLALLFFLFIAGIQIWGQVSLLYAIKDSDENIGILEAYRRGWHKILSYWWVSFLVGIITAGAFLLFFVPGFIFLVWFSLALFVLVAEDIGGMAALLKSREYVRGKWWGVMGRLIFIFSFSFLISLVLSSLNFLKIPFLGIILNFFIPLLIAPLIVAYLFYMYRSLQLARGEFSFTPVVRKKVKIIFVGFLSIILIVFVGILASILLLNLTRQSEQQNVFNQEAEITSQDQMEIANLRTYLRTYRNKEYNFELSYPSFYKESEAQKWGSGQHVATFSYQETNFLSINIFDDLFENYNLIDNPGGFLFHFDTESKQWLHQNNQTSEFVPKKIEVPVEAYIYKSGDILCSWDRIVIPHPSYSYVVDITNVTCAEDYVSDEGIVTYKNPDFILDSMQILSTFKFIK